MGSGPARALSLKPKHTYEVIDYEDDFDSAVIALESDHLPNGEVMAKIAEECQIDVANVCAVVALRHPLSVQSRWRDAVLKPPSTNERTRV